ncbi:MAG: efflux RND transporter permease subunit [Pseudomonadota bacterium]
MSAAKNSNAPSRGGVLGPLVETFARHRNAANLLMVLMVLFGLYALARINTQFFPTIATQTVTVSTAWSGASAEDVASNVLEVIEPEVRFIDGVKKVQSYAREGNGSVFIEFEPDTDMLTAKGDVDAAVSSISNLPEDAETPKVSYRQFFDRVAKIALYGDVPEQTLAFYARQIRDDLIERGIDKVSFAGLRDEELRVTVPERELRRLDLSVEDISRAIAGNSRDQPSGKLDGNFERQLRAVSDVETPRSLGDVKVRAFSSGEAVRLSDIARIENSFDKNGRVAFSGKQRAIELTVERAPTADTLKTAGVLADYLAEIDGNLPAGLNVVQYDVSADRLSERIWLLVENGLMGLAIVVAVLFIFLNARIAFWVAAGIPVAMMATLGLMYITGQTVNMISLFALIMTLGIIVDDAIVVGEHTATRFAMGDEPTEAAINGAGRMVTPVIAAMLTTLAAFAPILLIGDTVGQIMGVLPLVVMAVIVASLVECFLVLPGHLAHGLQPTRRRRWSFFGQFVFALGIAVFTLSLLTREAGLPLPSSVQSLFDVIEGWVESAGAVNERLGSVVLALSVAAFGLIVGTLIEAIVALVRAVMRAVFARSEAPANANEPGALRRGFDAGFNWFRDHPFRGLVRLSYSFRYVTVALCIGAILIGVVGLLRGERVGFVFFPSPEAESLNGRIVFYAGTPEEKQVDALFSVLDSLDAAVAEIQPEGEKLVHSSFTSLGTDGRRAGDNVARISVQLTSSEERSVRTSEILRAWRAGLPTPEGVRRLSISAPRAGPPGSDIDIELQGPDVALLKSTAEEVLELVSSLEGVSGARDNLPYGNPELVLELTPRGESLGFSIADVGQQLRNTYEGSIPRRFARGDSEVAIRVIAETRNRGTANLQTFELRSPSGEFVPLLDVVNTTERQGFAAVERLDGKTVVNVQASLDNDVMTLSQAQEALRSGGLDEIVQAAGVDYRFSGRAEERSAAFADLGTGTLVALAVIYIILAWVFSSYWRPFSVMLIIPFGIVGAVVGHYLLDQNLTILSLIGLLGLSGILVNDSIILVSRLDERIEQGDSVKEAAIGASQDRLRAVLLTSLTTIGGLLPLLYEKSLQAQFLMPMAITMVFGLAVATVLVLFLVPCLVGIGDDIQRVFRFTFGSRRSRGGRADQGLEPAE